MWCPRTDSNRGPIDYKSIALPAELQGHELFFRLFSLVYQVIQEKLNLPTVVCGTGSIDKAHKADEYISINQLEMGNKLLDNLITSI